MRALGARREVRVEVVPPTTLDRAGRPISSTAIRRAVAEATLASRDAPARPPSYAVERTGRAGCPAWPYAGVPDDQHSDAATTQAAAAGRGLRRARANSGRSLRRHAQSRTAADLRRCGDRPRSTPVRRERCVVWRAGTCGFRRAAARCAIVSPACEALRAQLARDERHARGILGQTSPPPRPARVRWTPSAVYRA